MSSQKHDLQLSLQKDLLYSRPLERVKEFCFDKEVATVFDDMISRSVPLYTDIQSATAKLTERLVQNETNIYDLGCASGTTLIELAKRIPERKAVVIGVDNSEAMLETCRAKLREANCSVIGDIQEREQSRSLVFQLACEDIQNVAICRASVVILNYTLQFLSTEIRLQVLKNIHNGLLPGGALLLSEKVTHRSETLNRVLYEAHHDFKRSNGYSDLEIAQKRDALENVLVPLSTEENLSLLRQAGFREVEVYAKWYNFASIIAFRD